MYCWSSGIVLCLLRLQNSNLHLWEDRVKGSMLVRFCDYLNDFLCVCVFFKIYMKYVTMFILMIFMRVSTG